MTVAGFTMPALDCGEVVVLVAPEAFELPPVALPVVWLVDDMIRMIVGSQRSEVDDWTRSERKGMTQEVYIHSTTTEFQRSTPISRGERTRMPLAQSTTNDTC